VTLTAAILIGLVAALTHLDGSWLGEMKFREPIVTGFLVGLILGDVAGGLVIGAALQLIWMGITGVGVTPKLDIGVGGTIGAAVALSTGTGAENAVLFAVPVALLMQFVDTLMTSAFSAFMPVADRRIDRLDVVKVQGIHYLCGVIAFVVYFTPTFAAMYFGSEAIEAVVNALPEWLNNGLNGLAVLLPALGFAMLLDIILDRKLWPFLILGFVPAAFVGHDLSMVGIAAIAVAIALVVYSIYTDIDKRLVTAPPVPRERELVAANEWED
jgi:mannose/fructose/N-acetylgalactosamine-specific phosphotransferase system component IIC